MVGMARYTDRWLGCPMMATALLNYYSMPVAVCFWQHTCMWQNLLSFFCGYDYSLGERLFLYPLSTSPFFKFLSSGTCADEYLLLCCRLYDWGHRGDCVSAHQLMQTPMHQFADRVHTASTPIFHFQHRHVLKQTFCHRK